MKTYGTKMNLELLEEELEKIKNRQQQPRGIELLDTRPYSVQSKMHVEMLSPEPEQMFNWSYKIQ